MDSAGQTKERQAAGTEKAARCESRGTPFGYYCDTHDRYLADCWAERGAAAAGESEVRLSVQLLAGARSVTTAEGHLLQRFGAIWHGYVKLDDSDHTTGGDVIMDADRRLVKFPSASAAYVACLKERMNSERKRALIPCDPRYTERGRYCDAHNRYLSKCFEARAAIRKATEVQP
ncbi:MAG TPA: hypothetical protein VK421_06285 [Pyrinomonadaceae bacterium]|nr:hypothetical protein [Pyrinomonadaceae bacterium]